MPKTRTRSSEPGGPHLTLEDVRVGSTELLPEIKALLERFRGLRSALTVHLPAEAEATAMLNGQRPPSLAWFVDGMLGEVVSALEEVVQLLEQVAATAEPDLLADWLRDQCNPDHIHPRYGLANLATELRRTRGGDAKAEVPLPDVDAEGDSGLWHETMLRAAMVDLAQQLYRARSGEGLEIPPPEPPRPKGPAVPLPPPAFGEFVSWLQVGVGWCERWLSTMPPEILEPPSQDRDKKPREPMEAEEKTTET